MKIVGYKQSEGDHTLFVKHSALGMVTVILVYVDDIIVIGNDLKEIEALKRCLKEFGRLKYFLGIEVMTTVGYKQSHGDHTFFVKYPALGIVTVLLVYVDDIIVTRNDLEKKEFHAMAQGTYELL